MRVPAIIYAPETLIRDMDHKVYDQLVNVASLPGIVQAAYAMPDAHWGYGFPIGGVAAFDPEHGGVVSAGGVGFDISCGVRTLSTGLTRADVEACKASLAEMLFVHIPAGLGSTGAVRLSGREMDAMLAAGARWAVEQGYGTSDDLNHTEEQGCAAGARPEVVSAQAKQRQKDETGTLGSGNHYLEVQVVSEIFDRTAAQAFGLEKDDIVISIHCGSRGLGHQIGTEFLKQMAIAARDFGIRLPDRELARAPLSSQLGQDYLGAMRAGINCALANRQILTQLTRGGGRHAAAGGAARDLRRIAQHLQRGTTRNRWRKSEPVRTPQRRDPRAGLWPPQPAAGIPRNRATGADRRTDGDLLLCARRAGE